MTWRQRVINLLSSWSAIQALLFYIAWFLIVGAVSGGVTHGESKALFIELVFVGICLGVVFKNSKRAGLLAETKWLLSCGLVGLVVDGVVVNSGFYNFPHTELYILGYPYWMIGMWLCFGTSFSTSLGWLRQRVWLQALFGGIGGGASILAAARLGAVTFPLDPLITGVVVVIEWAVVTVLLFAIFERRDKHTAPSL